MITRSSRRLRFASITAVAIGVLVSACGGSDSGGSDDSGPSSGGLTKSAIPIGVVSEQSGPSSTATHYPKFVADAWAEWVNKNGGINGHPIKISQIDTKGDPATAQSAVQQAVENDKIVALVGGTDGTDAAWLKYAEAQSIPIVGGSGTTTEWSDSPIVFQDATLPQEYTQLYAPAAKSVGDSVGLVVCSEVAACAQAGPIVKAGAESLGVRYDGLLKVASTAPNYTGQCVELKSKKTEVIMALLSSGPSTKLSQDCSRQGYTPFFGQSAQSVNGSLADIKGFKAIGVMQGFPWWLDDAPVAEYRKVMKQSDEGADQYQSGAATNTWASLEMFRKAIAEVDATPTPKQVMQALYDMKPTNLDGLLPQTVDFDPDVSKRQPFLCGWVVTLEDGTFASKKGLTPTCAE
jgi:branched-chain amino acid transport system substrate-binding protein